MGWKRLTFILIPHSQEHIKQINVHRRVLYGIGFSLIAAIAIMIFYIIGFKGKSYTITRTRELQVQNEIMSKYIAMYDSTLTSMDTKIANLEKLNSQIMLESNISEMDLKLDNDADIRVSEDGLRLPHQKVLDIIARIDIESSAFEFNVNAVYESCMNNIDFVRHVPSIRPTDGYIGKEFGVSYDNFTKMNQKYLGVDIYNIEGTPVYATAEGFVSDIRTTKELGRYIEIDHHNGYITQYAHLELKVTVKKGDAVTRGQQIGTIGFTGNDMPVVSPFLTYAVTHNNISVNPVDYFFAADFVEMVPDYQEDILAVQVQ